MCTCACACVSSRGRGGDAGVRAHLRAHGASLYFSGLVQEHRRGGSNLTLVFQSNRAQWARFLVGELARCRLFSQDAEVIARNS